MGEIAVHLYRETYYDADAVVKKKKKKKETVMEVALNAEDEGFGAAEVAASSSSSDLERMSALQDEGSGKVSQFVDCGWMSTLVKASIQWQG
jgi:hypothetical protein